MKIENLMILIFSLSFTLQTHSKEPPSSPDDMTPWRFSISTGAIYSPKYLGDDDYGLTIFPNLSISYEDTFFASFEGISFRAINHKTLRAGPIAKYDFGRDEDGSSPLSISDDTTDLIGLGDVDGTLELGFFLEYSFSQPLSAKVEVLQGVNGHEGLVGNAELKYNNTFDVFGNDAFYSLGVKATFADEKYNSVYFDVNAVQSAASGLSQFDAGAGLQSIGFHSSIVLAVTERVSVIGIIGYDRLSGDVADSSIVRERGSEHQSVVGFLLSYQF